MLTAKSVYAIEQVLLMNSDICDLYEERGVSREDLRAVFKLASEQTSEAKQDALKRLKAIRLRRDMNNYQDSGWSKAVAEETDRQELDILRQLLMEGNADGQA